ncbi:MAG: DUF2461 domain-containing protein [Microbacter sp.]
MALSSIIPFLTELKENNQRDWFALRKNDVAQLQGEFSAFIQQVIDGIAFFDQELKGVDAKNCVFRLYRDIRFSPDKTPYKTHFAAYMAAGGRKSPRAGYYLHIEPNDCFISGGIYCPEKDILKALRKTIHENIDEWEEVVQKTETFFPERYGDRDKLKKVPAGFSPDDPATDWLKYKHYIFSRSLDDHFYAQHDIVPTVVSMFQHAVEMNRFINFVIDELSHDQASF